MIVYLKDKFEAQAMYLVVRNLPISRRVHVDTARPISTRAVRFYYNPRSKRLWVSFGVRRGNDVVVTFEEFINLLSRAHLEATRGNHLTLERLHNSAGREL